MPTFFARPSRFPICLDRFGPGRRIVTSSALLDRMRVGSAGWCHDASHGPVRRTADVRRFGRMVPRRGTTAARAGTAANSREDAAPHRRWTSGSSGHIRRRDDHAAGAAAGVRRSPGADGRGSGRDGEVRSRSSGQERRAAQGRSRSAAGRRLARSRRRRISKSSSSSAAAWSAVTTISGSPAAPG